MTDQQDEAAEARRQKKLEGYARETARLLANVYRGETKTLRDRVANVLNKYPATRSNERAFHSQMIREYSSELIDADGRIHVDEVEAYVKLHLATRERAHIQYDLGLFQAEPEVTAARKKLAAEYTERFTDAQEPSRVVTVFADESGKGEDYLVFGSLWVYRPSEVERIAVALKAWREETGIENEMHFTKLGGGGRAVRGTQAHDFFARALAANPFGACIALALRSRNIESSAREASIFRGFSEMVIAGVKSEIAARKLQPPVNLTIFKDADAGADDLHLARMRRELKAALQTEFPDGEVELTALETIDSRESDLIQVSDLFTSVVSRHINMGAPNPEGNDKAQFAARVNASLGFYERDGRWRCLKEPSKILYLDEQT